MCGRFTLAKPQALPAAFPQFRFAEFSETRLPRYNIAPTQEVLGVRNDGPRPIEPMRWGVHGRINIRAESIAARRRLVHRGAASSLPMDSTNGASADRTTIRCVRANRSLLPVSGSPATVWRLRRRYLPSERTGRRGARPDAGHPFRESVAVWLDPEPLPAEARRLALAPARGRAHDKCARCPGESITRTTMRPTCLAPRTLVCSESV